MPVWGEKVSDQWSQRLSAGSPSLRPFVGFVLSWFTKPLGSEFVFWLLPNKQLLLNKQLLPAISRCYGLAGRPDCSN